MNIIADVIISNNVHFLYLELKKKANKVKAEGNGQELRKMVFRDERNCRKQESAKPLQVPLHKLLSSQLED